MSANLSQGNSLECDHGRPSHDAASEYLLQWFLNDALPTWFDHGVDWSAGGFFERLTDEAQPYEAPRRTRVVARQIYVFCVAYRQGWAGRASQDAIRHGLSFLLTRLLQPDGLYASAVDVDGAVLDARFDLYEQAFALFALAHAHAVCPDMQAPLLGHANHLLDVLEAQYKHPVAGFQESLPSALPLRANPHMHLFEAALAWEDRQEANSRWHRLSDELAELALNKLIDHNVGVLSELFDEMWQPVPGDRGLVIEPGHQFEWGWLLIRWGRSRQRPDAVLAAKKMIAMGQRYGVCARRHVAINQLDEHLAVTDDHAKLWPQTEWIKACHALGIVAAGLGERQQAHADTCQAIDALRAYLRHPHPGLWHEVMRPDGAFSSELCRASSLYHVVCAIDTLQSTTL